MRFKILAFAFLAVSLFISCEKDDDSRPGVPDGNVSFTYDGVNYSFELEQVAIPRNEGGGERIQFAGMDGDGKSFEMYVSVFQVGNHSCDSDTVVPFVMLMYEVPFSIVFSFMMGSDVTECSMNITKVENLRFQSPVGVSPFVPGRLDNFEATFSLTLSNGKKVENGVIKASRRP